jgi:hypothetical protein
MHTNHKRVGYSVNPLVAAVTGAVVGAGMAVAGAVVMSDKKNQDKVKSVAKDVQNKVDDLKKKVEDKKFETEIKAQKLGNIAKDAVNDAKNI